jgi:hypothetical protein
LDLVLARFIGLTGGFQRSELGLEGAPVVGLVDPPPDGLDLLIDQLLGLRRGEIGV